MAPTGRGAEPQVLTMVPRATRRPLLRQASALFRTSTSTLSMGKCYRNPQAAARRKLAFGRAGALAELERRPVAGGDVAHDGEAEAAAGARRARHAVEALERSGVLPGRDARAVVLYFDKRMLAAFPGAHRDVPAALGVLQRVVHQVGERLAQQEGVAAHRRRLELEAQVKVARQRPAHPGLGLGAGERLQVQLDRLTARAGLRAREREELVGEARGADRRLVHLLDLRAAGRGQRLRQRELGVRLQSRERRAQLVRRVGEEALLAAA